MCASLLFTFYLEILAFVRSRKDDHPKSAEPNPYPKLEIQSRHFPHSYIPKKMCIRKRNNNDSAEILLFVQAVSVTL